jgi:beta-glucanase (GH16 family)
MKSLRTAWTFLLVLSSALGAACGDSEGQPQDDGGAGGAPSDTGVNTPRDATGGTGAGGGPDVRGDSDRGSDGTSTRDGSVQDAGSGPDGAPRPDAGPRLDGGSSSDGGASTDASVPGWTLVWSDEFNAAAGTGADTTKWNLVNKGDGFGNNELQFYTNRPENAYHDGNGFLVIKAMRETYMGRQYTSARLESNGGKFQRTYGRFESRMQLPRGQGIWPAFWMLGNNIGSAGWPTCGEIDIMENIGREPSIVHGTLHGPGYSGGSPLTSAYTLPSGARFADGFHVFAVEWELNVVRWYMDDVHYATKGPADTPSGARWVYDHPFYLLLNVAVGGNWPGAPDSTTVFPQTLTVDYVRVYSR